MKITPFTFESLGSDEAGSSAILTDGLGEAAVEAAEEEVVVVPSFNEEELSAAKQESYDDGFMAGKKEGLREAEHLNQQHQEALSAVVKQASEKLDNMQQDYQNMLQDRQSELAKLVIACAEKLAGEALRKDPASDISEMIDNCLSGLFDNPEIIADVHPEMAPLLQDKFPKTVTFSANEALQLSDCTLSWKHGQAMRDTASLWSEVEDIIGRHFTAIASSNPEISVEATLEPKTPEALVTEPTTPEPTEIPAELTVKTTDSPSPVEAEAESLTETPSNITEIKGEDHE